MSTVGNSSNSTQPGAGATPTPATFTGDVAGAFGSSFGSSMITFVVVLGGLTVM